MRNYLVEKCRRIGLIGNISNCMELNNKTNRPRRRPLVILTTAKKYRLVTIFTCTHLPKKYSSWDFMFLFFFSWLFCAFFTASQAHIWPMRQKVQMMLLMLTQPSSMQREAPLEEKIRRNTSSRQWAGVLEQRSESKLGKKEEWNVEQKKWRRNKNPWLFPVFHFFTWLER